MNGEENDRHSGVQLWVRKIPQINRMKQKRKKGRRKNNRKK